MFSSIRLGSEILLTLLDKDKGEIPELPLREQFVDEKKMIIADEDKTRVISLKSLMKVKTEKVRKKRLNSLEAKLKKKKTLRNDKALMNNAIVTAFLIIAGTFAAMKTWGLVQKRRTRSTIVGQMKQTQLLIDDEIESFDENVVDLRIALADRLSLEEITKYAEDANCSLQEELFFCKRMPRGSKMKNGAININGQLVIYLEQQEWLVKAQELVTNYNQMTAPTGEKVPTTPEIRAYDEDSEEPTVAETTSSENELGSIQNLNLIATLTYLKEYLSRPLPIEIQPFNLYFVLYSTTGSQMKIESVLAIRGSVVGQVNLRYSDTFFMSQKFQPMKILKKLGRYYRVY